MGTGHLVPPTGTTAERPTGDSLKTGGLRYNSTLVTWEGYNGTQWTGLGGGNPWQTFTADGSTTLTAQAGKGYFLDTNTGVIEVFLPSSPSRGDTIVLADYGGTFGTNQIIINTGGKLIDSTQGPDFKVTTDNSVVELVYVDANKG